MQITLSFEAHELPSLLAQLIKLSAGDVAGLAAAVIKQAEHDSQSSPAEVVNPLTHPAEAGDAASFFSPQEPQPVMAEAIKTRKPRGPNKPKQQPAHTQAVNPADLAPSLPLANSPGSVPAASPADQTPAAITSLAPHSPPATVSASTPQVAAGSRIPTLDELRDAYMAAEMRGAKGEEVLAIIAAAGVSKVRDIPDDKKLAALQAFQRINAAV